MIHTDEQQRVGIYSAGYVFKLGKHISLMRAKHEMTARRTKTTFKIEVKGGQSRELDEEGGVKG